jgi:large repetitive protein
MIRRLAIVATAVAAALLGTVGVGSAASTTSLLLSQSTAFAVLGHSCGGIQEQALSTGFDAVSGYPAGDVYVQTRCGGSGRGGGYHVTTYSAWMGATWDFTGAAISSGVLPTAPTNLDPAFSATDPNASEVFNVLTAVNVLPANCTVGNTTYCAYRAYLTLGPTFVPAPRVTGVSSASGPAAGGTSLTITGTGFTDATAVSFGGTAAASFTVNGDTSITTMSPAEDAGTVDVTVTSAGGTDTASAIDQFTFVAAPSVSGADPNNGTTDGGTSVTITGTGFTDAMAVDFGGTAVGFTVNDDTSITAVSPAAEETGTVDVTVTTLGGTSATGAADGFTYTLSTGCGGSCTSSVQCAKLGGTAVTMTVSKCAPKSAVNVSASASSLTNTFTWKTSGETTIEDLEDPTSPGRGGCAKGSVEYDISGVVAGGTSAYTAVGDTISARTCQSPSGKLSLVKGTKFSL